MMKKSVEFGRTMIETLAVLFIMGMLGVTSIVIYDGAMNNIRAQQIIDQVMLRIQWKMNDKERQARFKSRLNMGTIKNTYDRYKFSLTNDTLASVSYKIVNKDNSNAQVVSTKLCQAIKKKATDSAQFSKVYTNDSTSATIAGTASGITIHDCPTTVIKSVTFQVNLR